LIWNGSEDIPRAGRATVKVTFNNLPAPRDAGDESGAKKIFDIDFLEVAIERVVHRDGLNEYFINGSSVRLKDVLELLARAHIGASGHHIISQGEADKILSASPKERKGMVEDALGLRLYQYKRAESERKIKKTFENITQVEALRKEILPHLKFLGKQVEKIEKTESMRGDLLSFAREYFKHEDAYVTSSRKFLSAERKPLDEALKKLSQESQNAKKIIELESGFNTVQKEKDDLTREIGKLEGFIITEQKLIDNEKRLSSSDEFKTVKLKEIEELFREISALFDVQTVKKKFQDFINERKHHTDSVLITEAEVRISDFRKKEREFEIFLEAMKKKEHEISEAEKAVFRIMSEENELISKLNLLKSKEENLNLIEQEFKRELEEVSHIVGIDVLRYKDEKTLLSEGEIESRVKQEERKREIQKLKIRLEDSNTLGMEEVRKEYKDTSERDEFLARELDDLKKSAESLDSLIKELETRLAVEFSSGLEKINKEFDNLFTTMFGGGEASLSMIKESLKKPDLEEEDLAELEQKIEEGLEIKVSLPKKKIRGLVMLSGGERALTSIALIFAISQVNPPPFIILDETDAALDESNSKKYGDLVNLLSQHSQLILITHNRETMSRAGIIYGVTMGLSGISKLLSISFDEAVEVAK